MSAAYMNPTTLSGLKEYVSGSSGMQQSAESTVLLYVTHCHLKAQFPEIRLDKHVSVHAWGPADSTGAGLLGAAEGSMQYAWASVSHEHLPDVLLFRSRR